MKGASADPAYLPSLFAPILPSSTHPPPRSPPHAPSLLSAFPPCAGRWGSGCGICKPVQVFRLAPLAPKLSQTCLPACLLHSELAQGRLHWLRQQLGLCSLPNCPVAKPRGPSFFYQRASPILTGAWVQNPPCPAFCPSGTPLTGVQSNLLCAPGSQRHTKKTLCCMPKVVLQTSLFNQKCGVCVLACFPLL